MTTDRNSEAVACDHCGAPCREEVLMRGGDNGWGDDKSRTVKRYTPPATIPVAGLEALVGRIRARAESGRQQVDSLKHTEWHAGLVAACTSIADELAQLIQEAK